jgi:hypothetical protein
MIEKEHGNSKVHRFRVIHIYEADYNFLLQAKWRNLISNAETHNLLHPGQYGSRPGRNALIPAFIEEMKKSLINFDNDAASCYDRIIPALASLIGRKFGLHCNVVFVHAKTLEETKYKLKTSLGVSNEFYENCQALATPRQYGPSLVPFSSRVTNKVAPMEPISAHQTSKRLFPYQ